MSFESSSRVRALGSSRYSATFDDTWLQGRGVYGGMSAAVLHRAAEAECGAVSAGLRLRSMALQYAAPVPPGEVELQVEVVRRSTSAAFTAARIVAGGGVAVHAQATYARDRQGDLDEDSVPALEVPGPDDVPELPYLAGVMPVFTQHVAFRLVSGAPFSGGSTSRIATWLRFRQPPPADDVGHVLALLDGPPPAFLARARGIRPASTVSFQLHVLRPPPAGDPAGWWFIDVRSSVTTAGWSDEEMWLYGPDRRPVAVGRQLVALLG